MENTVPFTLCDAIDAQTMNRYRWLLYMFQIEAR